MAVQQLVSSPLIWIAVAAGVMLSYMLAFVFPGALLRWRFRGLRRKLGDIRTPVDEVYRTSVRVQLLVARALREVEVGDGYGGAASLDRIAGELRCEAQAELLNLAAACHHIVGRSEPAVERYMRVGSHATDSRAELVASGLANIALLRLMQGELELARAALERALELDRESGNRVEVAVGLGRLGLVFQARGDTARALDMHLEALAINEALGNRRGIAFDLGRIGLAYQSLGEREKALEYYRKGLAAARKAGDRVAAGEFLGNIGLLHLERNEDEAALVSLLGALALFGEIHDTGRAVNTIMGLKLVRDRLGAEMFAAGCGRLQLSPGERERLAALLDKVGGGAGSPRPSA